jgi:hypothetical protein
MLTLKYPLSTRVETPLHIVTDACSACPPPQVAQLAGYVSEHSAYHHGEASLQGTIVGLAQDFVGSNNLNLLYPSGQFGTRLQGGKDAASARQARSHSSCRLTACGQIICCMQEAAM